MAKKKSPLAVAEAFFYKHGGFSYDPKKETREQGKRRSAKRLAEAERDAASLGITFEWEPDEAPDISWMDERQKQELADGETTMMSCVARGPDNKILDSLTGIHMSGIWGNDPYKRVVEAELALEAVPKVEGKSDNPPIDPDKIDDFTKAYIAAALWSTNDDSTPSGGEPLDSNYSPADIAPDTLRKMIADCKKFQKENKKDIAKYNHPEYSADELAGHDFWLTRNHHGTGVWDREESVLPEKSRDRLNEAADKFGEFNLYIGDDGRIYGD